MKLPGYCECGKPAGRNGMCASCSRLDRKAVEVQPSDNNSPINKFSKKGADVNRRYLNRLKTWKRGKKCTATFAHDCDQHLGIECHHMAGRSNDSFWDEWAAENGVVLTLDERFWRPLCGESHRYITNNPKFAYENQYSFKRITDPLFRQKVT